MQIDDGNVPNRTDALGHHLHHSEGAPRLFADTSFMRNPHYHQMSDTIDTLDLTFFCAVVNGLDGTLAAL